MFAEYIAVIRIKIHIRIYAITNVFRGALEVFISIYIRENN